jgi:phage shock protein A
MQARAGALDELLQSGVLEDVGGDTDDIQQELDEAGTAADVDGELAALKAEIGTGSATPELTSGSPAAGEAGSPAAGGPAAGEAGGPPQATGEAGS